MRTHDPASPPTASSEGFLAFLLETLPELNAAPDLRTGLELVAERLQRIVPYDNLAVLLLDERGRELRFELAVGYPEGVAEHWRFGLGQGIVGTVAENGEPVILGDTRHDHRYLAAGSETRSELAVALRTKDRIIGVLDVGSREPDAFTTEHQRLLSLLAGCLATAIDGRRLYQNLREQTRMLSVLHEVSRELTSILDRRRVLERVGERLKTLIDYDVFTVLLWNEENRLLEPWAWVRSEWIPTGMRPMRLGEGISGSAAALRQPIRVPNVSVDPRFVACDRSLPIRSEIAVPLLFEDRLIGVLDLESFEYDAFRQEHEQLLGTLASSLAIALANAEMYQTLEERERRLDEDLATARKVQRQLLPKSTPWVRGLELAAASQTARHLGGDFYDFFRYGDGRIGIAVGDVAGKATSAALYAALTVGILRELSSHTHPQPAEMLTVLNEKLLELDVQRRFVAMSFAVYDVASQVLTFANAGLPYPFLLRGRGVREIELGGVPLGQLRGPSYEPVQLELEVGDTVVLLSDGVTEALDRNERSFGGESLRRTLAQLSGSSSRALADGLVETVRRFSGTDEPADDRTVVVLRRCSDCPPAP